MTVTLQLPNPFQQHQATSLHSQDHFYINPSTIPTKKSFFGPTNLGVPMTTEAGWPKSPETLLDPRGWLPPHGRLLQRT